LLKIDTKSTRDWNNNYPIRDAVFTYIYSHDILANDEEFRSFIDDPNPVFAFYAEKAKYFLKTNTGE
jgi:hypothetical protein